MPVVVLPNIYLFAEQENSKAALVNVQARTALGVLRELAERLPKIGHLLLDGDGNPRPLFNLYRDSDGEDVRYRPDDPFEEDEKLLLIYAVGD